MRVHAISLCLMFASFTYAADSNSFTAGVAQRDITPPAGVPMWGYAARHDAKATGTADPLVASAVVIEANGVKLAIVATDLGRGPTSKSMVVIREEIKKAGIEHVLITGSHSHHGPVLELTEKAGEKFKVSAAYSNELTQKLIGVILEADKARNPAHRSGDRRAKLEPQPARQEGAEASRKRASGCATR